MSGGTTTERSTLRGGARLRYGTSTTRRLSRLPATTWSGRSVGSGLSVPSGRRSRTDPSEYCVNTLDTEPVNCTPVILASSNSLFWSAPSWTSDFLDRHVGDVEIVGVPVAHVDVNGAPDARLPEMTQRRFEVPGPTRSMTRSRLFSRWNAAATLTNRGTLT